MQNLKSLASLCSLAGRFESYLVANPVERFFRDVAHIVYQICMSEYFGIIMVNEPRHKKTCLRESATR